MTGDTNRGGRRSSNRTGSAGKTRRRSPAKSTERTNGTGKTNDRRRKKTASDTGSSEQKKAERRPSSAFIAYLDTEFNAFDYYGHNGGIQEVIEIGLVVMRNGELVDGFRSFCALKEGHTLTRRAEQLTGITKDDMADAPHFIDVIEHMNVFLDMYNPAQVYAYGPEDRMQLLKTAELYHLNNQELYYINKISDIMKELKNMLGARSKTKLSLSVKDICAICGIDAKGIHDAYNDALYLGRSAEMIMSGQFDPSRLDKVLEDKNWLSGYRSSRRFKEQRESVLLRDEQLEPVRYAISRLRDENRYPDYQLRALWDDLRVITGRAPEYE